MAGHLSIALIPPMLEKGDRREQDEEKTEPEQEREDERHPGLLAAVDALADAFGIKPESIDREAAADALYDAFSICDSMPHDEGEHTSETEAE